jgi:hypothetical protein
MRNLWIAHDNAATRVRFDLLFDFAPGRTGASYIDDARLNINDITKIIIDLVITYNNTQMLHKQHLRTQMIEGGIMPKPLDTQNWGVQNAPQVLRKMRSDTVMIS